MKTPQYRFIIGFFLRVIFSASIYAQSDTLSVFGTVTDRVTGEPISFATVACQACHNGGTLTNEAGAFEVFPRERRVVAALTVSHILYGDATRLQSPASCRLL